MRPARKEAMDTWRKMKDGGASKAEIMRQIVPKLGSKAGKTDMLKWVRDHTQQRREGQFKIQAV